jgi:hypothetical protein
LAVIETIYDNWLGGALLSEDAMIGIADILHAHGSGVNPEAKGL